MMKNNLYMNGEGVMAKTHELNEKAWEACSAAILGMSAVTLSLVALLASFFIGFVWVGILQACFIVPLALRPIQKHNEALRNVKEHCRKMDEQTQRSGRGWARS